MKRAFLILVIAFCTFLMSRAEGVQYFKGSVYEAMESARKQHKMLIVEFYAKWNSKSRWTNENIIANKDISKAIDYSFVIVKVDTQTKDGASLASQYQVRDYPSFIIFNQNGNVVDKIEQTLDKQDFLARLEQVILENDGKSGWELRKIFNAVEKNNSDLASELTKDYILRIGKQRAISPIHWDLYSNLTITHYGSWVFDFVLENREQFNDEYTKIATDELINKVFLEAAMPYAIGVYEHDSVYLAKLTEKASVLDEVYTYPLLQLVKLSELRSSNNINEFLSLLDVSIKDLHENMTVRLLLSLDFIAESGDKDQKGAARKLIRKYGRNTDSTAEHSLINLLEAKLSE